jgi:hypothetical protein
VFTVIAVALDTLFAIDVEVDFNTPEANIFPTTFNFSEGLAVPIPTFCDVSIVTAVVALVCSDIALAPELNVVAEFEAKTVPLVAGNVSVVVPDTAGAARVTVPEVSPATTMLAIYLITFIINLLIPSHNDYT